MNDHLKNTMKYHPTFNALRLILIGFIIFCVSSCSTTRMQTLKGHTDIDPVQDPSYSQYTTLLKQAISEKNSDLCQQARQYLYNDTDKVTKNTRRQAINGCYFFYANTTADMSACSKISSRGLDKRRKQIAEEQIDNCIFNVLKSKKTFTEKNCHKIKEKKGWFFAQCIKHLAQNSYDPELCNRNFDPYTAPWHGCRSSQPKRTTQNP